MPRPKPIKCPTCTPPMTEKCPEWARIDDAGLVAYALIEADLLIRRSGGRSEEEFMAWLLRQLVDAIQQKLKPDPAALAEKVVGELNRYHHLVNQTGNDIDKLTAIVRRVIEEEK